MKFNLKQFLSVSLLAFFSLFTIEAFSQNKLLIENRDSLMKYLKLNNTNYKNDNALVISEWVKFFNNTYKLNSTEYEIIYKVFNKNDISDLTEFSIPVVVGGNFKSIVVKTYNLNNDNIDSLQITKTDLLKEVIVNGVKQTKFSVPGIKEGSVVYVKYNVIGSNIRYDWVFQKRYPILYSRFDLVVPNNIITTPIINSTIPFKHFNNSNKYEEYNGDAKSLETVLNRTEVDVNRFYFLRLIADEKIIYKGYSWTRKNLKPFEASELVVNPYDYIEKVMVNLNGFNQDGLFIPNAKDWENYTTEVWYELLFKEAYKKKNLVKPKLSELTQHHTDSLSLAKGIYNFFRDEFAQSYILDDLELTWKKKEGQGYNILILMNSMLVTAGYKSEIVAVSTIGNQSLSELLPNPNATKSYFIKLIVDNKPYFLYPLDKQLPFGMIPSNFYNGYSRVINPEGGYGIYLNRDLLKSEIDYNLIVNMDAKNEFKVRAIIDLGNLNSYQIRNQFKKDSTELMNTLKQDYQIKDIEGNSLELENFSLENIHDFDKNVKIRFQYALKAQNNLSEFQMPAFLNRLIVTNPLTHNKERKIPIQYHHRTTMNFKLNLLISNDKYFIHAYPESEQIVFLNPYCHAYTQVSNLNDQKTQLILTASYEQACTDINEKENNNLLDFYNKVISLQKDKIIIKTK